MGGKAHNDNTWSAKYLKTAALVYILAKLILCITHIAMHWQNMCIANIVFCSFLMKNKTSCYVARRNQAQTREVQNQSCLFRREIRKPGKSESNAANTRQRVVIRKWASLIYQ